MAVLKIRNAEGNVQEILVIKGENGKDGKDGVNGENGVDGKDYVLTDADKQEIAEMVANIAMPVQDNVDLSNYYTKNEVNALIPTVPTLLGAFVNDVGYLTEAQVVALIQANMPVSGDEVSY